MKKEPSEDTTPPAAEAAGAGQDPDEILPEYDFRGGVRGKYAAQYAAGTNLVLLDPDVAAVFPDSAAVNAALRALAEIARRQSGGKAPAA